MWVFDAPAELRADSTLRANAGSISGVVSGWFPLDSLTGRPLGQYPDDAARASIGSGRIAEHIALVTTYAGRRFHPEAIRSLATHRGALAFTAARLATLVGRGGYDTALLDFEGAGASDTAMFVAVTRAISDSLRGRGLHVGVMLPGADTLAYSTRSYLPLADFIAVTLDDEHWSTSAPGPIASPLWVRRVLARRVAEASGDRFVAVLPLFSYLWRGTQPAELLTFTDARRLASEAGVELARDPISRALHAVQPGAWELWMTDAEQLDTLSAEVRALGVERVAWWRAGVEDPGVWRRDR